MASAAGTLLHRVMAAAAVTVLTVSLSSPTGAMAHRRRRLMTLDARVLFMTHQTALPVPSRLIAVGQTLPRAVVAAGRNLLMAGDALNPVGVAVFAALRVGNRCLTVELTPVRSMGVGLVALVCIRSGKNCKQKK